MARVARASNTLESWDEVASCFIPLTREQQSRTTEVQFLMLRNYTSNSSIIMIIIIIIIIKK